MSSTTSLFQTLTASQNEPNLNSQPQPNNIVPVEEQLQKPIPKFNVFQNAPVFFANSQKEDRKRPLEPEMQRSGSITLNYGDRRLSNILSDTKNDHSGPSPAKKMVLLEPADPTRGLFGDGNVHKYAKVKSAKKKDTDGEGKPTTANSTSIRVYGFPTHLTDDLKRYYEKYGNVVECKRSLSDWITVKFDKQAPAMQALKTNNTEIYGYNVRIIPNPEPSTSIRQGVITLEESKNLLKEAKKPTELGEGKEGVTAFDGHMNEEGMMRPVDNSFMAKLKETFLGW